MPEPRRYRASTLKAALRMLQKAAYANGQWTTDEDGLLEFRFLPDGTLTLACPNPGGPEPQISVPPVAQL